MPDYGERLPPYFSGRLPKGILGNAPYGWTQQAPLSTDNTPFNAYFPAGGFVYERLDWAKFKQQLNSSVASHGMGPVSIQYAGTYSNPPFMGAGQMMGPNGAPEWMRDQNGGVQRIVRGYLRRSEVNANQPESFVRLYFMYNPDQVQRQYLSWSENTTADPTAQFGYEPDVSPSGIPAITTITFTLYFDRQIEVATSEDHPGVLVDLQTFDVLSGNMIYTNANGENLEFPVLPPGTVIPSNTDPTANNAGQYQPNANGMHVSAIFSPSLAVDGMLSGVTAQFTKFSKRMTPMTMALTVSLMVNYAGKANNQSLGDLGAGSTQSPEAYNPKAPGYVAPRNQDEINYQTRLGASQAVVWANNNLMDSSGVHYSADSRLRLNGPPCNTRTPFYTDCSSFVWRSFWAVGWSGTDQTDALKLGSSCTTGAPGSITFYGQIMANSGVRDTPNYPANARWTIINIFENYPVPDNVSGDANLEQFMYLRRGDVLVQKPGYRGKESGHVAFFESYSGKVTDGKAKVFHILQSAGGDNGDGTKKGGSFADHSIVELWQKYNFIARPEPFGKTTDWAVNTTAKGS